MRRLLLVIGIGLALSACGSWKGDGTDEAIPDVLGQATGIRKAFGVPSQTYPDNAAYDMKHNRAFSATDPFEEEAQPAGAAQKPDRE